MERTTTLIDDREKWLKLRERNVNASEIAALFTCHPYTSALRLWAEKSGKLPREAVENMATRRGQIFEAAVGEALRLMHPEWKIAPGGVYHQLPEARLGCTPDFVAKDEDGNRFLIQAKTVTPDKWESEWTPTPPLHFLLQVQTEMLVAGHDRALLAVMVMDGQDFPVYEYWYKEDAETQEYILLRASQFWGAVEEGREPKLDGKHDRGTLAALYPDPDREAVASLHHSPEIIEACAKHKALGVQVKALEAEREAVGAVIVGALRNHSKAEAGRYRISWPAIAPSSYTVNRAAHRRLTITERG